MYTSATLLVYLKRLRQLVLGLLVFTCVMVPPAAQGQALSDDELRVLMITTVVAHDAGIPIGLLPFPITQLGGELIQYTGNIALKGFRPYLTQPKNGVFDVAFDPNSDNDADRCSYTFYLPNSTAEYENIFGIIPIRSPYYDAETNTNYLWQDRWGVLPPPRIYHANSTARLSVRSTRAVRRYDENIGAFVQFDVPFTDSDEKTEFYYPILDGYSPSLDPGEIPRVFGVKQLARVDQDGQLEAKGPQQVYLPIGAHTMEWTAATQLNTFTDILVPGALLAFAIHSEVKTAKNGVKAAKKVKQSGIGDNIVDQADNAADSLNTKLAKRKFNSIWEGLLTRKKPGPIGAQIQEAAVKKFIGVLDSLLDKVIGYGVTIIEAETGALLQTQGQISSTDRKLLDMIFSVALEEGVDRGAGALKDLVISSDYTGGGPSPGAKFVLRVVIALLKHFGLEEFVQFDTGVSHLGQRVIVWDNVPPTLAPLAPLTLEATDFGGTRRYRAIEAMRAEAIASASDNCGRMPDLTTDAPELLLLGETIVTWTATDKGPNPNDGQDYAPTALQMIIVQDTQPPLLLAPPSKVIESATDLTLAEADIGNAVAVDLADVQPVIANNAPTRFPLDRRSEVQWSATDKSGNTAQASQLITIKTAGTNTQPVAEANSATTLTAEPVDIRLTAKDIDVLDGIADPLWFKIESQPQKGEFIAPLYPFFINDYRTKPGDGLGDSYDPENDTVSAFIQSNYCEPDEGEAPPRNFVHEARFVQVPDDGIRYVLDEFFECGLSKELENYRRFSKWNAAGDFLGQMRIGSDVSDAPLGDTFVIDRDGFLYYNVISDQGGSQELLLKKCETDFDNKPDASTAEQCVASYKFSGSDGLDVSSLSYARIDSSKNIIYVADARSIFAFEPLGSGGSRYIGELGPKQGDTVIDEWFGRAPALEVGSDGSLFIADSVHHRIHKIAPITQDDAGEFVLGDYVGWAGRCTGSGDKACDEALGRSRGYSCTFEPESCTPTLAQLRTSAGLAFAAGAGQGQFDTPKYIAIDPNDVLYIADYENERVQRLSPDGSFAGEAVSEGSGINKGERPSFVLGNMGKPASVSVNSSQFFVVDRQEQFVHVFGTLPFKNITDNAATVTYVSDQDFPNPNDSGIDTFTFSVSDGLADSEPATVSVTVNRNFRAPLALAGKFDTLEDTPLDFRLPADDPDGIKDEDFLGLDTLTYTITAEPQYGVLNGNGADRTYTPDADYYGEDTLRFKVNDGRDGSNEAIVTLNIVPVNDPPVLTIDAPERAALGFPTLVTSTFMDDPSDGYQAAAAWGDRQFDSTGSIVYDCEDPDIKCDDPRIEGVAISEPPMPEIEGQTFSEHTYATPGLHTVQMCVTDSGMLPGCDSAQISVERLVSLGMGGSTYAEPLADDEITQQQIDDDKDFTYELMIVNAQPSVGTGLDATAVTLEGELPGDLGVSKVTIDRGSCSRDATALSCALGYLEPGAEVTLKIEVAGPGNLIYNEDFDFEGTVTTTAPALEPELDFLVSVELVADGADSDGDGMSDAYENAYGLDPTQDDGDGDGDGDGLTNLREFELGTSPIDVDSDGDGLSDFDEDAGGITDPANADTDGDGMPDGWELANGFDPAFEGDGGDDRDGDGRTNAEEFEQGGDPDRDDVPPELTIPPDIKINATGALNDVDIGTATAIDGKDGELVPTADYASPFPTGPNVVNYRVTDAAGNTSRATQRIDIVPIANFSIDQTVPEKFPVQAVVELNGIAVDYPVVIPYSVTGTATNPDDHDATDGAITITDGISGRLDIDIVKDRSFEPDETLTLTMGELVNAVPGVKTSHTITIAEPNIGPIVTITARQQGRAVTTVTRAGGPVSVVAELVDYIEDRHTFDWSAGDAGVTDPADLFDDSFDFDPAGLTDGLYRLRLKVTDDGAPVGISDVATLLKVVSATPQLDANADSDGDGIADADEGSGDADGDRVPDYLDDIPNSNQQRVDDDGRLLETETGLTLRLGETLFGRGARYVGVTEADISEQPDFGFPSGVVDFEVTGLEPGGAAHVVVPLVYPIPANARYQKFADDRWQDFIVGLDNAIASAPGRNGACPSPGSPDFVPGLVVGFGCVQLTLEDGGPNDADRLPNGTLLDPGGLAVPVGVNLTAMQVPNRTVGADSQPVVMRLRLQSDSGDIELTSLTLEASGQADDRKIEDVRLVVDRDGNGQADADDELIAAGRYDQDNGQLTLTMLTPYKVPVGITDLLVIYDF